MSPTFSSSFTFCKILTRVYEELLQATVTTMNSWIQWSCHIWDTLLHSVPPFLQLSHSSDTPFYDVSWVLGLGKTNYWRASSTSLKSWEFQGRLGQEIYRYILVNIIDTTLETLWVKRPEAGTYHTLLFFSWCPYPKWKETHGKQNWFIMARGYCLFCMLANTLWN